MSVPRETPASPKSTRSGTSVHCTPGARRLRRPDTREPLPCVQSGGSATDCSVKQKTCLRIWIFSLTQPHPHIGVRHFRDGQTYCCWTTFFLAHFTPHNPAVFEVTPTLLSSFVYRSTEGEGRKVLGRNEYQSGFVPAFFPDLPSLSPPLAPMVSAPSCPCFPVVPWPPFLSAAIDLTFVRSVLLPETTEAHPVVRPSPRCSVPCHFVVRRGWSAVAGGRTRRDVYHGRRGRPVTHRLYSGSTSLIRRCRPPSQRVYWGMTSVMLQLTAL